MTTISLTNLLTNGNFESDMSGWTKDNGVNASIVATHKYGSASARLTNTLIDYTMYYQNLSTTTNHIYYICAWGYREDTDTTAYVDLGQGQETFSSTGSWVRKSRRIVNPASLSIELYTAGIDDYTYGHCMFDGVMVIDLTNAFAGGVTGTNKEPLVAHMDALVSSLGGYWDGTLSLDNTTSAWINYAYDGSFENDLEGWGKGLTGGYTQERHTYPITFTNDSGKTVGSSDGYGSYNLHLIASSDGTPSESIITVSPSIVQDQHYMYATCKADSWITGTGTEDNTIMLQALGTGGGATQEVSFNRSFVHRSSVICKSGATGSKLDISSYSDNGNVAECVVDGVLMLNLTDCGIDPSLPDVTLNDIRDAMDYVVESMGGYWESPSTAPTAGTPYMSYIGTNHIMVPYSPGSSPFNIIDYDIYQKIGAGSYSLVGDSETVNPWPSAAVPENTTYYFKIKERCEGGVSAFSNEVSITTPTVPSAPTITDCLGYIGFINIFWNTPADGGAPITGYDLWHSVNGGANYSLLQSFSDVTHFYTDGSLGPSVTKYYKVVAKNAMGDSSFSMGAYATTESAPAPPTSVAGNRSNSGLLPCIRVVWNASVTSDTITNYKIYRNGSVTATATVGNVLEWLDDNGGVGYAQNASATYTVSAVGAALGEGVKSGSITGYAGMIPDIMTTIHATASSVGGNPSIALDWTGHTPNPNTDTGITAYKVYYLNAVGVYVLLTTLGGATTTCNDNGTLRTPAQFPLPQNARCYYKVLAANALGDGPQSAGVFADTPSLPGVPRNLNVAINTPTSIGVTWEPPTWLGGGLIALGYQVYWGVNELDGTVVTAYPTLLAYVPSNETWTTPMGLTPGRVYKFSVLAVSAMGSGSLCAPKSIVLPTIPDAPEDFSVKIVNGVYPVLTWTAPKDDGGGAISSYKIKASVAPTPTTVIATVDTSSREAIDINPLVVGSPTYYGICATNSVGDSSMVYANATIPVDGVDNKVLSVGNLLLNGSFDLDRGTDGWTASAGATVTINDATSGMFYEDMVTVLNGILYADIGITPGHTILTKCKSYKITGSPEFSVGIVGSSSPISTCHPSIPVTSDWVYNVYTVKTTDTGIPEGSSTTTTGIRVMLDATGASGNYDGVMAIDLTSVYGHGAVITSNLVTGYNPIVTILNTFIGGYWEGTFALPKLINGALQGRVKTRLTLRGQSTTRGRLEFYFKDNNGVELVQNKWWFTDTIAEEVNYDVVRVLLSDSSNIYTYDTVPMPYTDEPEPFPGPDYIAGWPVYVNNTTMQNIPLLYADPTLYETTDLIGNKLCIEFYTYPSRFTFYSGNKQYCYWAEVSVNMANGDGLEGFGSLMVTSDYTCYVRMTDTSQRWVNTTYDTGPDHYMSLNFLVNSWFVGDNALSGKEDLGKQAPYFRIPVYTGDTLMDIKRRIEYGDGGYGEIVTCDSLETQLNTYFNKVGLTTGLIEQDSFNVTVNLETNDKIANSYDFLSVRVYTTNEQVQNEISCYAYQTTDLYVRIVCNQYFINDNVFELRSYFDMYGIDKPIGNTPSTAYTPLAFGFKFPLDYITDYNETESSQLDITPIPGQSSAKAIGIDAVGAVRDITINGVRVDNSNIWTFHVPWQEEGENRGIIYTGTSNWGWIKFMKAVLGCFQMTSGPYRLIMMTVPSSSQMQYFPTRDGSYQYSDGTYVVLAGWEDMCYVMVENFTYSRSTDMINGIQYSLKLKRVTPLLANR